MANGWLDEDGAGMDFLSTRALFGGLFDNSGQNLMRTLRDGVSAYDGVPLPDLKWTDYKPEALKSEDARYSMVNDDPVTKSMQMDALNRLAGLANEGMSAEDLAGYNKASQLGAQASRAGTQSAIQDAQNRGVAGSGMEFAMREMANQGGAQRAQEAALQQAADSARQRALYNQAYLSGASQARGQDYNTNKANTDIINQFNMANTQNRNAANQYSVDQRNQAQKYNNEGRNQTAQQQFENRMGIVGGQNQARQTLAGGFAAQNAARTAGRNQDMKDFGSIMSMVGGM